MAVTNAAPTAPRLPETLRPEPDTTAAEIDQIVEAIERFHGDEHPGSFRFCYERPCREIAGITRGSHL